MATTILKGIQPLEDVLSLEDKVCSVALQTSSKNNDRASMVDPKNQPEGRLKPPSWVWKIAWGPNLQVGGLAQLAASDVCRMFSLCYCFVFA